MRIFLFLMPLFICLPVNSQSTASKQVVKFTLQAPQLDTLKTIWVYLPKNYENSSIKYPVIYMHDAQNLFDASTSYVGEWKIDETLDSLQLNVIIVGIEHGGHKRIDELTPYNHPKYKGGQGDAYLNFIIKTLKPYIDITYRTRKNRKSTGIWGSSLGGLLSFYAILKHPDVFGKAGVFSPSFWYSKDIFQLAESVPEKTFHHCSIYMATGSEEGDQMVSDHLMMTSILDDKGMSAKNFKSTIAEGENHNEKFWMREFGRAVQWFEFE